jgi:hypothetical protein
MTRFRVALLLPLVLSACGPLGPFSGGRLSGEVQTGPARCAQEISTIQLETNPGEPHSVNAWCVGIGDRLYVPTSMIRGPKVPSEREWVRNASADPRVRIRIAGEIYERTAVRVTEAAEYDAARAALEQKYELDPAERDPEREIWIFRLDPRSGEPRS